MKLTILRDPEPLDPRKEFDPFGTIACWHRHYTLGDVQPKISRQEWLASQPQGTVILPVYMYEHSGYTIRTTPFGDRFDSGQLGNIIATPEDINKNWLSKEVTPELIERAKKLMVAEVQTYDHYLTGQVWGYELIGPNGEYDSCWGFYGTTLEETGILAHMEEEWAKMLVEEAWEKRE